MFPYKQEAPLPTGEKRENIAMIVLSEGIRLTSTLTRRLGIASRVVVGKHHL